VSFVTDRDPAQQGRVAAIIEKAARAETTLLLSAERLTEFVYVLHASTRSSPAHRQHDDGAEDLPGVRVVGRSGLLQAGWLCGRPPSPNTAMRSSPPSAWRTRAARSRLSTEAAFLPAPLGARAALA